jgi:hypothetical protein
LAARPVLNDLLAAPQDDSENSLLSFRMRPCLISDLYKRSDNAHKKQGQKDEGANTHTQHLKCAVA